MLSRPSSSIELSRIQAQPSTSASGSRSSESLPSTSHESSEDSPLSRQRSSSSSIEGKGFAVVVHPDCEIEIGTLPLPPSPAQIPAGGRLRGQGAGVEAEQYVPRLIGQWLEGYDATIASLGAIRGVLVGMAGAAMVGSGLIFLVKEKYAIPTATAYSTIGGVSVCAIVALSLCKKRCENALISSLHEDYSQPV